MKESNLDTGGVSRRSFVRKTAAFGALSALSAGRVVGASERIGIGIIGFGLVGRIHQRDFMAQDDASIVAIAETYEPRLEAAAQTAGGNVAKHRDFRRVLDNKDVDAVVVSTPDHWHALITMMACAAGKDVYVEKPLTRFVREGRWMVQLAQKHKRVIQVGTQNRSGPNFQKAREFIRAGKLGEIVSVQSNYFRNLMPGFGSPSDGPPPPQLDWEMWQGPSPARPYNPNRAIYHFRWFWDYSGGQMTNLGQHSLDLVHWFTGVDAPSAVYSTGGRRFLKDNCQTPDIQDTILEYPGFNCVCQYREASAGHDRTGMGAAVFYGTYGTMVVGRSGYEVFPDPKMNPTNTVAAILGGHPIGGPQPVAEEKGRYWTTAEKDQSGSGDADFRAHVRNFLDCVRSRRDPVVDIETGHRVATACHLGNISLRTGRKITWDSHTEEIVGDPQASQMLECPYRKPWDAELRGLGVG